MIVHPELKIKSHLQLSHDIKLYVIMLIIIVYLLTQYELSCNLIGSLDLCYQLILSFRSVMVHSQGR